MYRKSVFIVLLLVGLFGVSAAQAQGNVVWNVEFFNDLFFVNSAAKRVDTAPALGYNWGTGAPELGVITDNFSARWGASVYFTAGTYRFSATVDDAVRVYIDGKVIIDTLDAPRPGQALSADVALNDGVHQIQIDFREYSGEAYLYFGWTQISSGVPGTGINTGVWAAQYYANPTLSGTPTLIQSEASPNHNWGAGSPVASIPADNFSARWTSVQTLEAGTYQINVQADDGVRVYVNGVLYIDQFHLASAQVYSANVTLPAGAHTFVIEYFESGGVAFLTYSLTKISQPPPPVVNPTGASAVVTAFRLNVRATPDPVNGTILLKISKNELYPVVGRNSNTTWVQINVGGTVGWVNARYVNLSNMQNVPVVTATQPPAAGASCPGAPVSRLKVGGNARVTSGVGNNLRSGPFTTAARVGRIPALGVFTVLSGPSCSGNIAWWQVNYNGSIGWTAEGYGKEYWLEPL